MTFEFERTDLSTPARPSRALVRYAWATLAYNVLVIVWGAVVRATGAGAGCGSHWPMCNGEVIPAFGSVSTQIEFSHRVTSGLSLLLVLGLVVFTRRVLPPGHIARKGAIASMVLILGEALIGAGLVLYDLVAHDASGKRALSMGLHLGNTFLLLGALAATAAWISGLPRPQWRNQGALVWTLLLSPLVLLLLVGASGAITALGDTLFPAHSLIEGLAQDRSGAAHIFVRLRVYHPMLATITVATTLFFPAILERLRPSPLVRRAAWASRVIAIAQWGVGLANVALLAPLGIQLVHLILADLLWIALALLAFAALAERTEEASLAPLSASIAC